MVADAAHATLYRLRQGGYRWCAKVTHRGCVSHIALHTCAKSSDIEQFGEWSLVPHTRADTLVCSLPRSLYARLRNRIGEFVLEVREDEAS